MMGLLLAVCGAKADIDLSKITGNSMEIGDKVLYGELAGITKISIYDGATVTLRDVTINGTNSSDYPYAGLTCKGDVTIILKGANTIRGFQSGYPAIHVPEGKTLTIIEDPEVGGSLVARSNGMAAAIGAGKELACGNIVIGGGTITAYGAPYSAGIGGAYNADCGDIKIYGGKITAIGGYYAAGIGSGYNAACGKIQVGPFVSWLEADMGTSSSSAIGPGLYGTSGMVYIGHQSKGTTGVTENYAQAGKEIYSVYNDHTLTFYHDDQKNEKTGYKEVYNEMAPKDNRFSAYHDQVTAIVIDPSLSTAYLNSMENMFGGKTSEICLTNAETITGMQYLKTTYVSNMSAMFYGCKALKSIDLSHFTTGYVSNMQSMFAQCNALESLDLSTFNTANVTNMASMFQSCHAIKYLDLTKFSFAKVTSTSQMFSGCQALEHIYYEGDLSTSSTITTSALMFSMCPNLKGAFGTTIVSDKLDKTYARLDKTDDPGYFSYRDTLQAVIDMMLAVTTPVYTPEYRAQLSAAMAAYINLSKEDQNVISTANPYLVLALAGADVQYTKWEEIDAKKQILDSAMTEMKVLLAYAQDNDYTLAVDTMQKAIAIADAVYKDPNATKAEVMAEIEKFENDFGEAVRRTLQAEKALLCESLDFLLKEGDSDEVKAVVTFWKDQVNSFAWDFYKKVQVNLDNLNGTFSYEWYQNVRDDVEAKRHPTGVEDGERANGEWRKALRDGQIYILKGEKVYTVQGQIVK